VAGRVRVRLPRGSERAVLQLLNERVRMEKAALAELRRAAADHAAAVRDAVATFGNVNWTLTEHARALGQLRELGRRFGRGVSRIARERALAAADLGIEQGPRAIAVMGGAALGRRLEAPRIDVGRARAMAFPHVEVRTDDVGARAGEDLATAGISASYLEAQKASPTTALLVGLALSKLLAKKAEDRGSLVVTTEVVNGFEWGGHAARDELAEPLPRIRKVWDATLDLRVCALCAELHHTVIDANEQWDGGLDDAPAHPRCRCATLPWLDDWSDLLRQHHIAPGPRTGVQAVAETQLAAFADRPANVALEDVAVVKRPGLPGAPLSPVRPTSGGSGGAGGSSGGSGSGGGGGRRNGDLGGGSPRRWYRAEDRRPPGTISISKGRMPTKDEMETARLLAKHGNTVHFPDERLLPHGKKFDVYVNGSTRVEMKRLKPESSIETVSGRLNTSLKKEGQARTIIIDARQTAISEAEAKNMLERRIPGRWAGRLDRVRIIGADFDLERGYP
jgi:hypothetical protein